ncbi:DUF1735 domain-containing protein [Mucilaginibacter flavus]|uniref:DUF1735 domain-containing protein n=1 Tax=Mucilaginibacter flavus TaxID=931504 RepID=UPI0025B5B612|nr:DUF1735 domain-containing protein [Mucilaginibacter flavus]MDN3582803.1 DUF1735 domain-containing protein [Mucilaginibacter flavus]
MKTHVSSILKLSACLMLTMVLSCKQEFLEGPKTTPSTMVYFPQAEKANALVAALTDTKYVVDSAANTANFSVPVYRGGESNFASLTVDVSVDNAAIAGLITSGALPANTVVLDPADYTIATKDTVSLNNNIMKGNIVPKIKIAQMNKYSGKTLAMGIKIANSSKQAINTAMDKVIIYFNADDFLDAVTPKNNMVDKSAWSIVKYGDGVTFKVNEDGSVLATGGNWGQQGILQTFQVRANKQYKIDMNVAGSGATDCWFEVYVGQAAPVAGKDYSDGGTRIALNTWNGCGKTPFDALLSSLSCAGNGNVVSFPTAGTVYLVIRSGGSSLGTTGIKLTNIDFRRIN